MSDEIDIHNLQLPPDEVLEQARDPHILDSLTQTPISEIGQLSASSFHGTESLQSLSASQTKEYVITLRDRSDLENFYDEMEHLGSRTGTVPDREVAVVNRREISRNTHYQLTDAEAAALRNDPRVLAVERTIQDRGIIVRPAGWQNWQFGTTWDKSGSESSNMLCWQPLRGYLGQPVAGWGSDGTAQTSATLKLTGTGKNVDVVIVDGLALPDHPEYAVNPDGSGGSRVIQYNWFAGSGTYDYDVGTTDNRNHGMHVMGTACGNTLGWARDANIYNIGPYGENGVSTEQIVDYIRTWHNQKEINPLTGRRNPTICNNSYGVFNFDNLDAAPLTRIDYRGIAYTPTSPATSITPAQALGVGVLVLYSGATPVALYNVRIPALDADMEDAINDGIIMVAAAGNWYNLKNDTTDGVDYNNAFYRAAAGTVRYHNQGISPACAGEPDTGVISVMNIDATVTEQKADTSCSGPRNQIMAPGTNIFSAYFSGGVDDPRSPIYRLAKSGGTSMASPGVCGALACMMEKYPWVTQEDCITYLNTYSTENQISDPGSTTDMYNFRSLRLAPNRYLFFKPERQDEAAVYPRENYWFRPSSGVTWPRRPARNYQPLPFT